MKFRSILRNTYLNVLGFIKKPRPGVHIINSHYVTAGIVDYKKDFVIFDRYLYFLNKWAEFISLEEATERIKSNNIPTDRILIAFTFDDGFEECFSIIAPLLEKYNTRGAFFINANYIESSLDYQKEFNERILVFTKKPMSWKQVEELHRRGHLIGSHNLDHSNFAKLSDDSIQYQVEENKRILELKLNYKCEFFAWTYGQFRHLPDNALLIVKRYHRFIFSGTNYKEYLSLNNIVINRRHQEAYWPVLHNKYFISVKKRKSR